MLSLKTFTWCASENSNVTPLWMLYLNVTICIPRESGSSDCIARMIAEPLPAGVLLNILWCLPWALCRPLVIMDQIEGKPNHYYAPGESHGLRTPAGYSPKGFKDWASKHVRMYASHIWGCHCWTKVSKRLNAEIIGERIFRTTGWFLIFAYQMWGFLRSSEVKASACNVEDQGSIPELGRSPGEGNGNPFQYSCLENPMDGGA